MEIFIKRIEILDRNSIAEFCALDTFYELTEGMGKLALIEFYKNTFNDLVNSKFKVESLEECWRA